MAERRMFAKTIIDSDAFLDMPLSSQALYFHLSMRADDDGFINNPKKIQRMVGSSDDDLKLLILKKFIIPFESGIVVIKHWKIHNYIRNDRYKETVYQEERAQLATKDNKAYALLPAESGFPVGIPDGNQADDNPETQDRLGKNRLGKVREEDVGDSPAPPRRTVFKRPSVEDIQAYCKESGYHISAERFVNYYDSNGWMVGRNKMKDWKAAVRGWATRDGGKNQPPSPADYGNPEDFYN